MTVSLSALLGLFLFALAGLGFIKQTADKPLPPGPPKRVWGDNRRDLPAAGKYYTTWHRLYGSVISFYLGRTPVIVLGTVKAATDLLDKRGNIYSSRPRSIMASEILSGGMRGIGMPYGQRWRNWRTLMHVGMGIEAANGYKALQSAESKILLRDLLLDKQKRYASHLRRFATSIVYAISYGRRVESLDDELVVANQKLDEYFNSVTVPGKFIVESYPILLYLPRPLQWFRREPEIQREKDTKLFMSLMNHVRKQLDAGIAQPSIAKRGLEKQDDFGLSDLETAYALSAPFAAGVGTTLAAFDVFLMAMLLYPSVMRKAQEELESFIGPDRLPDFEDANSLVYLNAVLRETLRWRPIAPLGVAHSVICDDVYEDMFIPKGSTVISNIHAMSQDEEAFPEPNTFYPERFLDTNKDNKSRNSTFLFGFGRRICPGMHVAQNSLIILASRVLWAFDVLPSVDPSTGELILPSPDDFLGSLVVHPRPFEYRLVLRKESARDLILEAARQAEAEVAPYT